MAKYRVQDDHCGDDFEEWEDTRVRAQYGFKEWLMRDHFGYAPAGWQEVWTYSPGIIVRLVGGNYFTRIGQSEYTGTLGAVERKLWEEYVKQEIELDAAGDMRRPAEGSPCD